MSIVRIISGRGDIEVNGSNTDGGTIEDTISVRPLSEPNKDILPNVPIT